MTKVKAKEDSVAVQDRKLALKKGLSALIPFLGFILIVAFFQIVTGNLISVSNFKAIFNQGFPLLIASLAGVFVMSTGNNDFSLGANAGFCCVCATLAATCISPWASIPVAILVGTLIGMLNGFAQTVLRLPSFMACLCLMFILTAGTQSLITGSSIMMPISMMTWETTPRKVIFIVIYMIVMIVLFKYTKVGKELKTLGVSVEAARQSGVGVKQRIFLAYTITGIAAGFTGFWLMLRNGGAATTTGSTTTTDVIISVVFGGMSVSGGATSKISAAILGTLIVTVLNNGMVLAGYGGDPQQLVKGLLFLIVVAVSTRRDSNTIIK